MSEEIAGTPDVVESAPTPTEPGSWLSALPQEYQDNQSLQETKSVEALAKRFIDVKSQVGNSIRVPGPDAPAEDVAKFKQSLLEKNVGLMAVPEYDDTDGLNAAYKALGLPEDASGYTRPEDWQGVDDERYGFLSAKAHEAGLSKKQFEALANSIAAADNEVFAAQKHEQSGAIEQLKGEWGNAYDQKVNRAGTLAKQLEMPQGLQDALSAGNVDAATYRWLDSMANKFGNEANGMVNPDGNGVVSEFTPTEVNSQITEITSAMMAMDQNDPRYQGLLDKRIKLAGML